MWIATEGSLTALAWGGGASRRSRTGLARRLYSESVGQGASPPSPHSTHVRLSRRTRGGEAEGLSSVVPQEGRITQYNLSLSTSSTRAAASKYGGALCRGSANPPGFSPALLRGGAGLRAALALQAVGLCTTSSTSHHEASKLTRYWMRYRMRYRQTCARRRNRVSALHRSHASPSPLSRHGPRREHGCHH